MTAAWDATALANARCAFEAAVAPAAPPSPAELGEEADATAAIARRCLLCTNRATGPGDPHQRRLCRDHEGLSLPCGCPAGTPLGMWGDHGAYCRRGAAIVHDPTHDPAAPSPTADGLAAALGLRRLAITHSTATERKAS